MTQSSIPVAKRTKQEILDEYEKLQEKLEELESTAKAVHSPAAVETVERAKAKTPQAIDRIFSEFQSSLHAHLSDVRSSLVEQSSALQDLQKAIELSRDQLQLQYNVALAADSLSLLVEEQSRRGREFDEQATAKKKAWEREAEEYEYQRKLKRERDQVETEEREKSLAAREAAIRAQEQEIAQMKKTIESFPRELEQALAKKERETAERLTTQFDHEKALSERETQGQAGLLKLTAANLEERLAAATQDIAVYKHQAEEANAKAQALAIKAIDRPTTVVAAPPAQPAPPGYHDRGQQGR